MQIPTLVSARGGTDIDAVGLVPIGKLLEPESHHLPSESPSPRVSIRVPSSRTASRLSSNDGSPVVRVGSSG